MKVRSLTEDEQKRLSYLIQAVHYHLLDDEEAYTGFLESQTNHAEYAEFIAPVLRCSDRKFTKAALASVSVWQGTQPSAETLLHWIEQRLPAHKLITLHDLCKIVFPEGPYSEIIL